MWKKKKFRVHNENKQNLIEQVVDKTKSVDGIRVIIDFRPLTWPDYY